MKNTLHVISLVIISCALLMLAGCDFPYAVKGKGFFHGEEPKFQPGPPGGADLVEIRKDVDYSKYKTIMMDPVLFIFESGNQYNAISPEALKDLREAFNKAFTAALKGAYPIVDSPQPDALRVRVAITDMVPLIQEAGSSGVPVSVGGASMKAEILDSQTKERIGAVMDTKKGDEHKAVEGRDEWENTKEVFNFWAYRLRRWLDSTQGKI